ncbi:TadE/TadG family type IV pilus assembly protein [Alsobacter sp. R-9]
MLSKTGGERCGQKGRGGARLLSRFGRDRRGSTAVEFAMLAIPFLSLVYAIFETSMVHMTGQVLQTAVTDASRLIMTGQAQNAKYTGVDFKTEVCKRVKATFDCPNLLQVDVQTFPNFASATAPPPPIKNGKLDSTGFGFVPGGPNQIVVVRAAIEYPIVVPLIGQTMVNLANNRLLIMASAAFKNEPYN